METDNTVSIWIGNFKNLTELENYINLTYDDEGEIVVSDFFNDFKIDINDIDEDLIEKEQIIITLSHNQYIYYFANCFLWGTVVVWIERIRESDYK